MLPVMKSPALLSLPLVLALGAQDGTASRPREATGATVAFTGDTGYHPPLVEHVRGCDLLIHEASHGANSPEPAPTQGHAGAPDGARIAEAAGVKQLALVHCTEEKIAD